MYDTLLQQPKDNTGTKKNLNSKIVWKIVSSCAKLEMKGSEVMSGNGGGRFKSRAFGLVKPLHPLVPLWQRASPQCHRLVSFPLKGQNWAQCILSQFPQGKGTWTLALWLGRMELFGPRGKDRKLVSSKIWRIDVLLGQTSQFSKVALTLHYPLHSQLTQLSFFPDPPKTSVFEHLQEVLMCLTTKRINFLPKIFVCSIYIKNS